MDVFNRGVISKYRPHCFGETRLVRSGLRRFKRFINFDRLSRGAEENAIALVQHDHAVAKPLDVVHRMRDENKRAALAHLPDLAEAFLTEAEVSDAENLVDEKDIRC